MTTAYCVKCREKREIKNPQVTELKNGRPAVKGTCPESVSYTHLTLPTILLV